LRDAERATEEDEEEEEEEEALGGVGEGVGLAEEDDSEFPILKLTDCVFGTIYVPSALCAVL
jgi:hypothetical protein